MQAAEVHMAMQPAVDCNVLQTVAEVEMSQCCCDRAECDKVAQHLRDAGIKAEAYHAGLSDTQRNNIQLRWIREDDCKASVPTVVTDISDFSS